MRTAFLILGCVAAAAATASAQTTYTYEYDVYGRLVRVERGSGTDTRVRYHYDSVDNRTRVKQGISAPVAVDDVEYVDLVYGPDNFTPLLNDTDADFPSDTLTITSLSGAYSSAYGTIAGGGTYIDVNGASPGTYYWTYTVQDADGNTDTGNIELHVLETECQGGNC